MTPKPGIKTSELWFAIVTVLSSVFVTVQGYVPQESIWAVIVGAAATVVAYILSRMYVKGSTFIEEE